MNSTAAFTARYASVCGLCTNGIKVGQQIQKSGPRYVHVACRQFATGEIDNTVRSLALTANPVDRFGYRGVTWESVVEGNEGWDGEVQPALHSLSEWMLANPGDVERQHRELLQRWMSQVTDMRARGWL